MGVDGVPQQRAAQFGLPLATPRHRVILGAAPPVRLDGGEIRLPCQPRVNEQLELLETVAEALLEDGHQQLARLGLRHRQLVDVA